MANLGSNRRSLYFFAVATLVTLASASHSTLAEDGWMNLSAQPNSGRNLAQLKTREASLHEKGADGIPTAAASGLLQENDEESLDYERQGADKLNRRSTYANVQDKLAPSAAGSFFKGLEVDAGAMMPESVGMVDMSDEAVEEEVLGADVDCGPDCVQRPLEATSEEVPIQQIQFNEESEPSFGPDAGMEFQDSDASYGEDVEGEGPESTLEDSNVELGDEGDDDGSDEPEGEEPTDYEEPEFEPDQQEGGSGDSHDDDEGGYDGEDENNEGEDENNEGEDENDEDEDYDDFD